jgi:hypothetical protein
VPLNRYKSTSSSPLEVSSITGSSSISSGSDLILNIDSPILKINSKNINFSNTSGISTFTGQLDLSGYVKSTGDITINGIRIGRTGQSSDPSADAGIQIVGENVFIGVGVGTTNTGGYRNTAVGYQALYKSGPNSPTNTAIGWQALYNLTGYTYYNTAVGRYALGSLTYGTGNLAMGHNAGSAVTTGSSNICIGSGGPTTGNSNIMIIGSGPTTGSSNILIGGSIVGTGGSESGNVIIGYISPVGLGNSNNNIILGDGSGNEKLRIDSSGNTGIGTTNPSQKLHVQGNARVTGAVYDSTNSPGTSGQVLQSTVTGTQWTTAAAGGGSGKFDTTIDNVLYIQPTGTLDAVGVGTTFTQITTLPGGSNKYLIHSIHVTNISNGDAEITAGFIINARKVPATISVSAGSSGGAGIHTFAVGSASSITVGMAVTGTGNIGETTGIGSTAGFQYNTYVTSVDGTNITLSKPMSGIATGVLYFSPVSKVSSRLPVPVGSAVELLKQPMVLNALDSIVLQSTGAGSGIGSTSTSQLHQTANVGFLTVTAGAAITNFLTSGMLVQGTGANTGIQTNTFVGVGYTPGSLSIPITKPATTSLASTSYSFTEVVVPQDGALQATIVYQSSTDTAYLNGTGTVVGIVTLGSQAVSGITSTIPFSYYGTGTTYPSIIQSIRVTNISDGAIYPGGDYPVSVGIGNSDTIFSYLAYNMVIPKNSSIELCEAPKRIGIGQSIFASSPIPGVIEIQVSGKQKTS